MPRCAILVWMLLHHNMRPMNLLPYSSSSLQSRYEELVNRCARIGNEGFARYRSSSKSLLDGTPIEIPLYSCRIHVLVIITVMYHLRQTLELKSGHTRPMRIRGILLEDLPVLDHQSDSLAKKFEIYLRVLLKPLKAVFQFSLT